MQTIYKVFKCDSNERENSFYTWILLLLMGFVRLSELRDLWVQGLFKIKKFNSELRNSKFNGTHRTSLQASCGLSVGIAMVTPPPPPCRDQELLQGVICICHQDDTSTSEGQSQLQRAIKHPGPPWTLYLPPGAVRSRTNKQLLANSCNLCLPHHPPLPTKTETDCCEQ